MANSWIQNHDYSSQDLGELTSSALIDAFCAHDWVQELASRVETDPEKDCPPGFGIVDGDEILHICPRDRSRVFFNLHYNTERRLFGLFPFTWNKTHYVSDYPMDKTPWLIETFMKGGLDTIAAIK